MTVAVLGATGKTGRRVTRALTGAGAGVREASRSSPCRSNGDDTSTWRPTLSGARAVSLRDSQRPDSASTLTDLVAVAAIFVAITHRSQHPWHPDDATGPTEDNAGVWGP